MSDANEREQRELSISIKSKRRNEPVRRTGPQDVVKSLEANPNVPNLGTYESYLHSAKSKGYLCLLLLNEFETAISEGNINKFKELVYLLDILTESEDVLKFVTDHNVKTHSESASHVILACKHNTVEILDYILSNNCRIFDKLSVSTTDSLADENCHKAFYYAIRSGNVKILDVLINKWPGDYFNVNSSALCKVIGRAYEELQLKNVPLTKEVELFVRSKLLNLSFFSNPQQSLITNLGDIKERIDFVLQNINLLNAEYCSNAIDAKFLFVAKFIASNIKVLKRILKSSYDVLPWEEIEFCLVSFVSSHVKQQEMNLFYNGILSKRKILKYLEDFAICLKDVKAELTDLDSFIELPMLKREKVVAKVVEKVPLFEELFKDFIQIRDVHSLLKITDYLSVALLTDPKVKEGQISIIRYLEILAECLKNTLESPNLSSTSNELLLLALPKATREVIINLRNSQSLGDRLDKKTELENNETSFFVNIKNDFKMIKDAATGMLCKNKLKMMRLMLKKVIDSENINDLKDIAAMVRDVNLDKLGKDIYKVLEHDYESVYKLTKQLSDNMPGKASYEKEMLDKIEKKLASAKLKASPQFDSEVATWFEQLCFILRTHATDKEGFTEIKGYVYKLAEKMPSQLKTEELKAVAESTKKMYQVGCIRDNSVNISAVTKLTCEIFYTAELAVGDSQWINDLRDKLNEQGTFLPYYRQSKARNVSKESYHTLLKLKLSELKSILAKNDIIGTEIPKSLLVVVELLVLNILTILNELELIDTNLNFLEDGFPVLTGNCLLEYLAYGSPSIDAFLFDPSVDVIVNAKNIILDNEDSEKIRKLVLDDPKKLKEKFDRRLMTIGTQEKMFTALREGNFEDLKCSLENGADINGKSLQLSTALHLATPRSSLEMFKFVCDQGIDVNDRDIDGQSVFHIAAAQGRKDIVEFLIRNTNLSVDNEDINGNVPLHLAAKNGHKDIVDCLLTHKADSKISNKGRFTPLFYAIRNNHTDIVKMMLDRDTTVNFDVAPSGTTCLHIASLHGHLDIVNYLLAKGAIVNFKNLEGVTPLNAASMHGKDEVVNTLIATGSDVNASTPTGMTSLHFAAKNGYEEIVESLLKNGAIIEATVELNGATPLYFAAHHGFANIVKVLLKCKADANICLIHGQTPLHAATTAGSLETVMALCEHGVNVRAKDTSGNAPLHCASAAGLKEIAHVLIEKGANVNVKAMCGVTPLHVASQNGHKDLVDLLIKNNADIEAQVSSAGWTPIHFAAVSGSIDVIEILLKNKANVNARARDGSTAVLLATLKGQEDVVAALIKGKANVNAQRVDGVTPLHSAALDGNKNIVELLVSNKAKVNVEGTDYTPLHAAVDGGNKEIVEIMLASKARVNVHFDGQTPLFNAVVLYNKDIVETLLANGANADDKIFEPLLLAAITGFTDIVKILLQYKELRDGVDVNKKDKHGRTCLHYVVNNGRIDIVEILIKYGGDVTEVTRNGNTPLHIATSKGYKDIVDVLLKNVSRDKLSGFLNAKTVSGGNTVLHVASKAGSFDIVQTLLEHGAQIDVQNNAGKIPLELADDDKVKDLLRFVNNA